MLTKLGWRRHPRYSQLIVSRPFASHSKNERPISSGSQWGLEWSMRGVQLWSPNHVLDGPSYQTSQSHSSQPFLYKPTNLKSFWERITRGFLSKSNFRRMKEGRKCWIISWTKLIFSEFQDCVVNTTILYLYDAYQQKVGWENNSSTRQITWVNPCLHFRKSKIGCKLHKHRNFLSFGFQTIFKNLCFLRAFATLGSKHFQLLITQ